MVTLNAGGSYALVATDAAGSVLSTQTLTVDGADGLTPGGDPADGTGADGDAADDELANTGLKSVNLAVGGGVLVLVGAGAVLVTRRRKSAQVPA
jgi:LPXTG-motif cell wall-anchored protein